MSRPPVVTIMGHVDHGKTSLLDAIRNANVVSGEAGGITQHIGAYQVEKNGQKITFIDTPGHAAFTAMRARGAQATDIAVLVVAADDSVMPQTIESINHAKAARRADHRGDQQDRQAVGRSAEGPHRSCCSTRCSSNRWAARCWTSRSRRPRAPISTSCSRPSCCRPKCSTSRPIPTGPPEGVVIEAKLDKGRGPVATVLVQTGTLLPGDIIVAGSEWGRVRALVNDRGEQIKEAGPATPVEVLGLQGTPQAGDRFAVVENEARAREITEYRQRLARDKAVARHVGQRGSLEQMMTQLQTSGLKEFPLVIKGDVQGSVEAITVGAGQARHRRGAGPHRACRRRRHHRERHFAGRDVGRRDHRLQRARQRRRRATRPSAPASRSATTTSSTISWMT